MTRIKRIAADCTNIHIGLIVALLAAQFGCATSFKNIPAAQVPPDAEQKVKFPYSQKISAEETKALFSELKGKIKTLFPGDPRFAPIAGRLESLEGRMVTKSAEDASTKNNWAIYGGLFLPLGLILLIGTMEPGGDPIDGQAWAEAYWLITLPVQVLVGSLTGYILADNTRGPEILPEHQAELEGIVVDYNALVDNVGTVESNQ